MQQDPLPDIPNPSTKHRPWQDLLLLAGGLAVIAAIWFITPGGLLDKADHVGYGVCHQIPIRSPFFGGRQLPLCARCSGQFLGALAGLVLLIALGRGKAAKLPPRPVIVVLLGFIAAWALDGFNSYLTLFPGAPHLYEPHNILRTTTGAMQGVALISLVLPFFNVTLWARPDPRPTIGSLREVLLLLGLIALIVAAVGSEWAPLLYPLALLSVAGTLMMLTLVTTMLVTLALRRDGRAESWRDALPLLVAGLALALIILLAINLLRAWLTAEMGLPF
ncbi:MAG TPA: DUF2085 domain-containing protein [Anaerolineae bacterium]|nr:DUF2085 domain-containing protein [Anaerolineae bacterium]